MSCDVVSLKTEDNKDKDTKWWEEQDEIEQEKERGVHVSQINKKVNTSGGNTVTPDAADCSSTCPLRFPRRPFCRLWDKSSAKSQHLSPPGALIDNGERKK